MRNCCIVNICLCDICDVGNLYIKYRRYCADPAISLHSRDVSLVQWTTRLLPFTRDPGLNPLGGYLCETGILL
jgi:hypothetical protein